MVPCCWSSELRPVRRKRASDDFVPQDTVHSSAADLGVFVEIKTCAADSAYLHKPVEGAEYTDSLAIGSFWDTEDI